MADVEAIIFDVFGTLVDWRTGIAREAAALFATKDIALDPLAFADAWRAEYQPAMQRIRSGNRAYVSLDILHRENLEIVLDHFALSDRFTEAEKAGLNRAWEKLPPWPDTVECLQRLKRKFIIAPCSNGSIALMARLARYAALPWDAIVGADTAREYKPTRAVYLKSVEALGCAPGNVLMVAAHNSDLEAARSCGLQTAFIVRPTEHGPGQKTDLAAEGTWTFRQNQFADLVEILGC